MAAKKKNQKTIAKKTKDNAKKIHLLAVVVGYNELAKQADVLGDKVWYRLAREDALKRLREAGGELEVTSSDKVVLTLREYPVRLAFTTADIELMRKAVAEYDEANKPSPPPGGYEHSGCPHDCPACEEAVKGMLAGSKK